MARGCCGGASIRGIGGTSIFGGGGAGGAGYVSAGDGGGELIVWAKATEPTQAKMATTQARTMRFIHTI